MRDDHIYYDELQLRTSSLFSRGVEEYLKDRISVEFGLGQIRQRLDQKLSH